MANDKFRVIKSVNKTSSGKGSITMDKIDETCLIINTGSNAGVYLGVNGGFGECVANYSQIDSISDSEIRSIFGNLVSSGAPINEALIDDSEI